MGVHNKVMDPKIKELLGVPEDEPIFILRAQDDKALAAVENYYYLQSQDRPAEDHQAPEFLDEIRAIREEFFAFQEQNPDRVKKADL